MKAFKKYWSSLLEDLYVISVLVIIAFSIGVLHILNSIENAISWIKNKIPIRKSTNHKN